MGAPAATAVRHIEVRRRRRAPVLAWCPELCPEAANKALFVGPYSTTAPPSSFYSRSMAVINVRMLLTLLAPFVLTLQMHTDVGDRARGRRPSGITQGRTIRGGSCCIVVLYVLYCIVVLIRIVLLLHSPPVARNPGGSSASPRSGRPWSWTMTRCHC